MVRFSFRVKANFLAMEINSTRILYRSFKRPYKLFSLVRAGLGYYYADADVWRLVSRGPGDEGNYDDACAPHHARCGQATLAEARRIRDLFTEASSKLVRFWGATTVAKRRSLARAATSGGAQTVDTN